MKVFPVLQYTDFGVCDKNIPMHSHNFMEWVMVKQGIFTARFIGFKTLYGEPGDIFVIPAKTVHDQAPVPDGANVFVLVSGIDSPHPLLIKTGKDPLLKTWFDQLPGFFQDNSSLEEKSLFIQTIWIRMKHFCRDISSKDAIHPVLQKAVNLIHTRLNDLPAVNEIARLAGISPSHLNLLFRKNFGTGVSEYVISMRLEKAKLLLQNPYLNIAETAVMCGFNDPNYFSRLFRKKTGKTPGEYRNMHQSDPGIQSSSH